MVTSRIWIRPNVSPRWAVSTPGKRRKSSGLTRISAMAASEATSDSAVRKATRAAVRVASPSAFACRPPQKQPSAPLNSHTPRMMPTVNSLPEQTIRSWRISTTCIRPEQRPMVRMFAPTSRVRSSALVGGVVSVITRTLYNSIGSGETHPGRILDRKKGRGVPRPLVSSGGRKGVRTLDLIRARDALSQLSYPPTLLHIVVRNAAPVNPPRRCAAIPSAPASHHRTRLSPCRCCARRCTPGWAPA